MMCSKLLRHDIGQGLVRPLRRPHRSRGCAGAYQRRLHSTLNFRALTLLILVGVLALTGVMYASTPRELAPEEDQGILLTLIKAPQIGNLDYIEKATQKLYSEVRRRSRKSRTSSSSTAFQRAGRVRRPAPQAVGPARRAARSRC